MEKYHVNLETGVVGRCSASIRDCPVGGAHFENPLDAAQYFESTQDLLPEAKQATSATPATVEQAKPVNIPAPSAVATAMALAPEDVESLSPEMAKEAQAFIDKLSKLDTNSPEFYESVDSFQTIGTEAIETSSGVQNRLLERTLANSKHSEGNAVAGDLANLRVMVEDLDPNNQAKGILGKLGSFVPQAKKIEAYFKKFDSSQDQITGIMTSLESGKNNLVRDNVDVREERRKLWGAIQELESTEKSLSAVSKSLESKIADLEAKDPRAAEDYRNDILVPVQQKHQDILTKIAVSRQGMAGLKLIEKNNLRLIGTVDRTKDVTMTALGVAVTQYAALDSQKRTIDQVNETQRVTGDMIVNASKNLRSQSAEISKQASNPVIATEKIKESFANLYATMDEEAIAKKKASETMAATISALKEEVAKAENKFGGNK